MSPTEPPNHPAREHRPAAGLGWMLPLYDPLTGALGIPRVHGRVLEHAGVRAGDRVLEIGCGTGSLTLLAKQSEPAATVVGLDPDAAALARARTKADSRGLDVRFDVGDAGSLPYPDASIDRVLSAFMVHHLPVDERARTFAEVRRVLRPDGSLHVVDFGKGGDMSGMLREAGFSTGSMTRGTIGLAMPATIVDAWR